MERAEAETLIRRWMIEYSRSVRGGLYELGIANAADKEDLAQEVFLIAFRALLNGLQIEHPHAWLRECAWNVVRNNRRAKAARPLIVDLDVGDREPVFAITPEQIVQDREVLRVVLSRLAVKYQEILIAVHCDGLSWDEIAKQRGTTSDVVRSAHRNAVKAMEKFLAEEQGKGKKKHRLLLFPLLFARVFDALRGHASKAPPGLALAPCEQEVECFMESTLAGADGPESERVSVGRSPPVSTRRPIFPAPARKVGQALAQLTGLASAVVLGYFLRGLPLDKLSHEPDRARPIAALATLEPAVQPRDIPASLPLAPVMEPSVTPEEQPLPNTRTERRGAAVKSLPVTYSPGGSLLLDRARVALEAGDAPAALALLAQHARGFSGSKESAHRRLLMRLVSAEPERELALHGLDAAALSSRARALPSRPRR